VSAITTKKQINPKWSYWICIWGHVEECSTVAISFMNVLWLI